jgi:hypothetical protein
MTSLDDGLAKGEGEFTIKGEAGNLKSLYERYGGNVKRMAKAVGCSYKTLIGCLADLNLYPKGLRGSPLSEADAENIVNLFKKYDGNVKRVHEETGFSGETIRRYAYKNGQEPRFIHLSNDQIDLIIAGNYVFDSAAETSRELGFCSQMTVLRYWKMFSLPIRESGFSK